jgi:hypothetical protein
MLSENPYHDPDKPCVADRLFGDLFECGIPTIAMYSQEVIDEGFVFPGARECDRDAELRSTRRIYLPVAAMIIYMMQDFDVTFYSYETMLRVYQLTTKHLDNWLYISQDTNSVRFPPMKELQAIEQLAIYMHNYLVSNGYGEHLNTNAVNVRFSQMLSFRAKLKLADEKEFFAVPKKYVYKPRVPIIMQRVSNANVGFTTNNYMARSQPNY